MNINGYRISVQFGEGNYVHPDIRYSRQPKVKALKFKRAHDFPPGNPSTKFDVWQSDLAEVMIDTPDGLPGFDVDDGILNDMVMGHCTSECVAGFIGVLAGALIQEDIRHKLVDVYHKYQDKYLD